MSATSKIEWTDATWNPVTGCTKVSAGCANCYAERMVHRFGAQNHGEIRIPDNAFGREDVEPAPFDHVLLHEDRLEEPLRWRKPRRIFVCSMGDLFHNAVPDEFIEHVVGIMAACSEHTFLLLTKRPKRMKALLSEPELTSEMMVGYSDYGRCLSREDALTIGVEGCGPVTYPTDPTLPLPNVWLGVSVENQAAADERIPILLDTPAAVRFVSCEPLLGPVDLGKWIHGSCFAHDSDVGGSGKCAGHRCDEDWLREFHWVICGGESGPGARPMHPDWARGLRDQCVATGVPFFFKQWGEWLPDGQRGGCDIGFVGHGVRITVFTREYACHQFENGTWARRVTKKAAGRLLDGREWNEYPEASEEAR